MPRIRMDLSIMIFDYRKRKRVDFWKMRTLLNIGIVSPQKARFLTLEWGSQHNKLDILELKQIR